MTTLAWNFSPMSSPTLSHFPDLSLTTKLQRLLFQLSHWSPGHMAHYNLLRAHYHSRNLYNLACFCDIKITCYTTKTLLDFVEICFPIHCHTISVLPLYFHVHILCTLYQNLTILEIIYVNFPLSTTSLGWSIKLWTITASMLHKYLDGLPLLQFFDGLLFFFSIWSPWGICSSCNNTIVFYVYTIAFLTLVSLLRDCTSHDDWLPFHNVIRIFKKTYMIMTM